MNDTTHHIIDSAAVAALIGTLFDYLPRATAFLTLVWVIIRLCETHTVRTALRRLRQWRFD